MKYSVELHVTQIHDVEVDATSYEDARNKAMQEWENDYIYSMGPTFSNEKAKVVRLTLVLPKQQMNN